MARLPPSWTRPLGSHHRPYGAGKGTYLRMVLKAAQKKLKRRGAREVILPPVEEP